MKPSLLEWTALACGIAVVLVFRNAEGLLAGVLVFVVLLWLFSKLEDHRHDH